LTQDDSTTDQGSLDPFQADRQEWAASGLMAVTCLLLLAGAGLLVLMLIKLAIPFVIVFPGIMAAELFADQVTNLALIHL